MDDVTRVHAITYGNFFRDFLEANQLCVFSSEITEDWQSRKEWVTNGKPNLEFLSNQFGKSEILQALENKFLFSYSENKFLFSYSETSHQERTRHSLKSHVFFFEIFAFLAEK